MGAKEETNMAELSFWRRKEKKSFCVYFFRGRPLWERERVSLSRRCVRDLTSERLSFVFVIPRWCSTCLKRWPARTKPPAPTGNEKRKKQFFSSSTIYGSVNFSFTEFLLAQQFIWLATMGGMFLLLILKWGLSCTFCVCLHFLNWPLVCDSFIHNSVVCVINLIGAWPPRQQQYLNWIWPLVVWIIAEVISCDLQRLLLLVAVSHLNQQGSSTCLRPWLWFGGVFLESGS